MMNADEQRAVVAALTASGVEMVKPVLRGATIVGYDAVPWVLALGRMMAAFGWSVRLAETPEAAVKPRAHLVRER